MWKVKDNRKSQRQKEIEEYIMALVLGSATGAIVAMVMM
jgi:hypothetical protein